MNKDYNKLIPQIQSSRKKPYPIHKFILTSEKYSRYVYYESINNIEYWHGCIQGIFCKITRSGYPCIFAWHFYSDSEEKCAKKVYQVIKKHVSAITKANSKYANRNNKKHINWQKWIDNYELIHNKK